ncbi:MAG: thiamine pyrophosphate-dependent enzyme [Clostridia bacterium]|nr:thiamine pyrophosphate-dependent enzyme [Clostridia bacterium]
MKKMLTGNQGTALGSYESGVSYATGYPGTPCTEVLNELSSFTDIDCEWSTNEKVALEVACGVSISGRRSLVLMKTLGLNVAADAFTQLSGTPINGGIVLVVADDVGRIVGDDYQDCRFYNIMSQVPLLEPSDSQEAREFMKIAFEISERFETPVIFRLNSITSKSKSVVHINQEIDRPGKRYRRIHKKSLQKTIGNVVRFGFDNYDSPKLKDYWHDFNENWNRLSSYSKDIEINRVELQDSTIGVIASGVSYLYGKEVLPKASFLKLGLVFPLPQKIIKEFIEKHEKVYVLEDGHPIIEKEIRNMGFEVEGESIFPRFPHMLYFTPDIIEEKILGKVKEREEVRVPFRLPVNCPGCSHNVINDLLKKNNIKAVGGIGCGGLGAFPHFGAIDVVKCMGSSFGIAYGFNKLGSDDEKIVGIMGDGEFWHTGINGLLNIIWNNGDCTLIINDNLTVAMTGGQKNISSPLESHSNKRRISIERVCRSIGVDRVHVIDSYDVEELEKVLLDEIEKKGVSVIISRRKCLIFS